MFDSNKQICDKNTKLQFKMQNPPQRSTNSFKSHRDDRFLRAWGFNPMLNIIPTNGMCHKKSPYQL